jgi:Tfp pilus assembly protein PilN
VAAQTLGSTTTTAVAPRVNLLPPEIAERSRLRRSQLLMVGTGLAAVAVVGVMYSQASAKVSAANEQKAQATAASVRLRNDLAQLQSVQQTRVEVDTARATLAGAMANDVLWSRYLHDITLTIPENVWLTKLEVVMTDASANTNAAAGTTVLDPGLGTVTIEGEAREHNDVAAWLESLAHEKGYANAYFSKSEDKAIGLTEVVKFSSSANVTEDALSQRYTKGLAR